MKSGFCVIVSAAAESDLIEVWFAIAENNPRQADIFLDLLRRRVESLSEIANRGAPRPELGRGVRMLVEGNYLLFYKADEISVTILRVLHGARDIEAEFGARR